MTELPKGWAIAKVRDLVDLGPKNNCDDDTVVGFIPMSHLRTRFGDIPTFEPRLWKEVKRGYTHFADGDVLLARITPCFENGKGGIPYGLPSGLGAGSTEYIVLRPKPQTAVSEFLLALFKSEEFLAHGTRSMTGAVGQQRVPKAVIESYPIRVPPFREQQRIAEKLGSLLSRVDTCRERLDRIPNVLRRFREAVLETAVTGGLTKDWRLDGRIEAPFPWARATLSEVSLPGRVITYGVIKLGDEDPSGVPCLRTSNVRWLRIETEGMKRISPRLSAAYSRTVLDGTEVLVNVRGTLGGVAAASAEMRGWNVSREVAVVPPDTKRVGARYLALWVGSTTSQGWLQRVQKGVAYTGINIEDLRALPVAVPSLQEQAEIVRRVDELFSYAETLEQRYRAAKGYVDSLTPSLLAKAFRGELVPQDPNDEPAQTLLERVRAIPDTSLRDRSRVGRSNRSMKLLSGRTKQKHAGNSKSVPRGRG